MECSGMPLSVEEGIGGREPAKCGGDWALLVPEHLMEPHALRPVCRHNAGLLTAGQMALHPGPKRRPCSLIYFNKELR